MKLKKWISVWMVVIMVGALTACSSGGTRRNNNSTQQENTDTESLPNTESSHVERTEHDSTLIVYFSLYGNVNYPDDIDASTSASVVQDGGKRYGTTECIAAIIKASVGGELHRIEVQKPYPDDFDKVTEQNHQEMENDYLPPLKDRSLDVSSYDTVFIGYPVWATEVPQAVRSFLKENDLSGKTVIPFCTHDGYGAGSSYQTIETESHAGKVLDGLAVEAGDVPEAQDTVVNWLNSIGLDFNKTAGQKDAASQKETAIKIMVGGKVLDGVLYDTPLAQEIKDKCPLTVSMSGYGGREYYGGIDFTPENISSGQLSFENGDITYCETNNSMAIFYAQTDHPDLTMEVIPIGKVTSDLTVFDGFGSTEDITFELAE